MSETATPISTSNSKAIGPGRPRCFDESEALAAAMNVFWKNGFEATSVYDLTQAMGLSRSSFYATFESKQALFRRALQYYSKNGLRGLREVAEQAGEGALEAMMMALSDPGGSPKGCLLINCITELAPHDEKVAEMGRHHLDCIEDIFARAIDPADPESVRDRARAYTSLAIGTLTLRKSGVSPETIRRTLEQARFVLPE
ncbi:TetR/AcrR family transcriptional regulator [Rhodobacterales bacterium]|nr:TetR/AcrR family transcriptional regulator [Rhodobacterales bacterium]